MKAVSMAVVAALEETRRALKLNHDVAQAMRKQVSRLSVKDAQDYLDTARHELFGGELPFSFDR